MRALGISFSGRRNGNCDRCLSYCLDRLARQNFATTAVHLYDHSVYPCGKCGYICFHGSLCPIQDSMAGIVGQCSQADVILWALPTYRGHLPAAYYAFSERLEGYVQRGMDIGDIIHRKVQIILIGNRCAGADTALTEALSDFADRPFCPESILLSSRDYHKKSIQGDMIDAEPVRHRLDRFIDNTIVRVNT